jgi:predicted MPP superfamily phosphohydrolase
MPTRSRIAEIFDSPRTRRISADVSAVLLAIVLGVIGFSAAARGDITVGPATLSVAVTPSRLPSTVVELPPFGSVDATTHKGPVRVTVRLREIDLAQTQRLLEGTGTLSPQALGLGTTETAQIKGLVPLLWRVFGGGLLAAALAGLLVALALRRGRPVVAIAVAFAVLVPSASVGAAYTTWHVSAFREPTLHGNLVYAPKLIDMFSVRVGDIRELRRQATTVADQLAAYYANNRLLASGGALPGTFRVVHVTDLHLDPVGAQLGRSITASYDASMVINTGDLPIFGSPVEGAAFASLIETDVPYVYLPGNHDSATSVAALRALGVTVLTTAPIEVEGLRIYGVPDPAASGFSVEPSAGPVESAGEAAYQALAAAAASGEPTPDVVAIHNPLMAPAFVGHVPLLLEGHTHRSSFAEEDGTVVLNSGTLGGMPYDTSMTGQRNVPYSASVLYFTQGRPRQLIAIDRIEVFSGGSTTVARQVVNEALLP